MKGHVKPELLDEYRRVKEVANKVDAIFDDWFHRPVHKQDAPLPNGYSLEALQAARHGLHNALDHMREDIPDE